MRSHQNILFILLLTLPLLHFGQYNEDGELDVKYIKAMQYFQNNDDIHKKIKKAKGKDALEFKVSTKLIDHFYTHWAFSEDLMEYDPDNYTAEFLDSLRKQKETRMLPELSDYWPVSKSFYTLHFSAPAKNLLLAKLEGADPVRFVAVFIFDEENRIKKVFQGGVLFQ